MHPPCTTIVKTIFDEEQKRFLRQRRPPLPDKNLPEIDVMLDDFHNFDNFHETVEVDMNE
jgi:hypothetical protein